MGRVPKIIEQAKRFVRIGYARNTAFALAADAVQTTANNRRLAKTIWDRLA